MKKVILAFIALLLMAQRPFAADVTTPFTGRIEAVLISGTETQTLICLAGANCLRIERAETNLPFTCDLVDRATGAVTLLFPNNRTYVQFQNSHDAPGPGRPNMPGMPQLPPGIGPQPRAAGGQMPSMPMAGEPLQLMATGDTTNLLDCACRRYELLERDEMMEIWAAQTNLPFAPYLSAQPSRSGPQMIEEQWARLLVAQRLFPLRAILKFKNGPERLHYEVKSIIPQNADEQPTEIFQPPPEYQRIEPLPF